MITGSLFNTFLKIHARALFKLQGLCHPLRSLARARNIREQRIIVYSMGKVGSSSIYYSLMKIFPFTKIYHNHFLSDEWLQKRLPGTPFTRNISLGNKTLAAIASDRKLSKYIVLAREPISRDLSNIIQNYKNKDIDLLNLTIEKLSAQVEQEDHGFAQEWFESEFKGHLGVDLYSLPFDKEKGYAIHLLDDRTSLLIIKLEAMNKVFEAAIEEFIGVNPGPLYLFNESSKKSESRIYSQLKSKYRLPYKKLKRLYDSNYVRYFYTDDQIKQFVQRWKVDG